MLRNSQKRPVLRTIEPLPHRLQNGLFVISQHSSNIKPQTWKDGALEQPVRLRDDFLIFALTQFPPHQTLLIGNPCQVFAQPCLKPILRDESLAPQMSRSHNLAQRFPESRPIGWRERKSGAGSHAL